MSGQLTSSPLEASRLCLASCFAGGRHHLLAMSGQLTSSPLEASRLCLASCLADR
ncbi:hypothetical protein J6590_056282 [Homalodisca vitripennis]|nr:hypothetical protein J6590_056282 [Homalodisca vitripennis]